MNLDNRALAFVLGITHILQLIVFFCQRLISKDYRGIGWWLMWSAAEVAGFVCILLREVPSIHLAAIVGQNSLIAAGVIALYVGIIRFLDKKENRLFLASVFTAFFIVLFFFQLTLSWLFGNYVNVVCITL